MNIRQTICLIMLSFGVVLIVFSFHLFGFISDKRGILSKRTASPLSPTEYLPEPVQGTDSNIFWILLGGIALVLVGGGAALIHRSK